MLEPEHGVGEQQPGQAEDEEGPGVLLPILLLFRVDAEEPVEQPLDGLDGPVEPGLPVGLEDPDEIEAHGLRDEEQDPQEERQLNPAGEIHRDHVL